MASTVREALVAAGVSLPPASDEQQLRREIARLTKIVQTQSREKRRLTAAYAKLKAEKRAVYEMIALAEQLQEEVEHLEAELARVLAYHTAGGAAQALANAQRSRAALSVRYGVLYRALRALLADPAARAQAEEALRLVADAKWVHTQLEGGSA